MSRAGNQSLLGQLAHGNQPEFCHPGGGQLRGELDQSQPMNAKHSRSGIPD